MTLEDFFTLTEMKNGLTTLARVEELICVMQKQKACATSNVGDAARQWSTVASTLIFTENQDCLSHFVYLNGLCFLNQWLQETVKCSEDATDDEELINVLLGSLEKLPVDRKKLSASGILSTVKKLFGHKTADIKVRAQILFERWNTERINDDGCQDLEKGCLNLVESSKPSADATSVEDKHGEDKKFDSPPCQTAAEEENCIIESGRNEKLQARSPNNLQSDTTDDGLKGSMHYQTMEVSSLSEKKEKSALPPTPTLDSSSEEKLSFDESSFALVEMASSSAPVSSKVRVKDDDEYITSATKNHDDVDAEMNTGIGVSYDSGQRDGFCVLSSTGPAASSPAKKPMLVRSASAILESIEGKFNMSEPMDTNPRSVSVDRGRSKQSRTLMEFKSEEETNKEVGNLLGNGSLLRKEDAEIASEDNLLLNEPILKECKKADELSFGDPSEISMLRLTEELDKKTDLDLESGEFDALEVARLVAIEVEREVVDYREQSCSSSTDVSSREIVSITIPDIAQNKQDYPIIGKPNGNGSLGGKDDSDTASSPKNGTCKFSEVTNDLREAKQRLQSPNEAAADQKTSNMTKKIKYDFDLNVDAFSENLDCAMNLIPSNPVNLSAPIAVSVSNGAPGWASTPLHFEGELGWRGSATTSAFRPASLRSTLDSGKTNSGSKPKENLIEIDLNVAESESDVVVDPAVLKELPVSYRIPSRDSSIEVSSGRAARIQLDLNSIGDEEAPSLQSSFLSHHLQKSSSSLSPTSSSSSRNPSMRNFDLNDNLFALDGFGSQDMKISNSSVFTLMSSKMPVERTDHSNQAHQTYMSGLSWDAFSAGRPLMPYVHQMQPPPGYGYNGMGIAPVFPFQSSLYGNSSIPLMAEARSATIMPQLMGSSGPHSATLSSHPFLMSMTSTPSSSNGVEPCNLGLDLNSSLLQMENGNREARSLNHFFMPGHSNLLEEQMNTTSQHSTTGLPLKRKEPDSGWDPYGFGYNQVTSWH